jgi:quercetin dioxygenase-like cupin family protein
MRKAHFSDVPAAEVPPPASGVKIRWLIDDESGAPNFAMRHFEIAPGGNTPLHAHEWEHEVFILTGSGVVSSAAGDDEFAPGDVIFMPGGETHNFRNTGAEPVTMLCLVPLSAKKGK